MIPAVDVLEGRVVRLLRGSYDEVTVYSDDPVSQAGTWMALGAGRVHVVDLAGARDGTSSPELWTALSAAGIPFQVGGGIRSAETAEAAVLAGAGRVVIGTAAVWDPAVLDRIVATVGAERVVAAIDVRDGRATGEGWYDAGKGLSEVLAQVGSAGVPRMLVTGIARDGTMVGPDIGLLEAAMRLAPGVRAIGSGGVGTLDHVRAVAALGAEGVIVGRALYENAFTLPEALSSVRVDPAPPG